MNPFGRLRPPSPATCLALLALFISLGGTTWAVTKLPSKSVGTKQLKTRAVTESKLADSAVVTSKLANGAVTLNKIGRGAIEGSRIAPDALGGDQIAENLLGPVPLAQTATRAQVATRAETADRVERVDRAETAGVADSAALADRATLADRANVADLATAAGRLEAEAIDYFETNEIEVAEGEGAGGTLACDDPGLAVINGGYIQTDDQADRLEVLVSAPDVTPGDQGWVLALDDVDTDAGGDPTHFVAWVMCIEAS